MPRVANRSAQLRTASSLLAVAAQRMRTLPTGRDWLELAGIAGVLALCGYGVSLWSHAVTFSASLPGLRADPTGFALLALVALLVPSLAEELVFRSVLQPDRLSSGQSWGASAISLALFILWHPIQFWTGWFTGQAIFLDPGFLVMAGLLGLACTLSVHRSGSLWGAVVLHWGVVVVWKAGG